MASDEKTSDSGNPIYIYSEEEQRSGPVTSSSEDVELIEKHIEQHVGKAEFVWHELLSDLVHIAVHWVKPSPARRAHTLLTTGMSDLPMTTPPGAEKFKYCELLITLPTNWELSDGSFRDEKNYWPIRLLKSLARFPHEYSTWLWRAHTVPNGNPAQPYSASTSFTGAIISPPITLPADFFTLRCSPDKTVYFFSVIPLYSEEMDLKLKKGADALFDIFDKHGVADVVNIDRANVGKKKWWQLG